MSYATRNENGDNMGNTFVRCPTQNKTQFDRNWDTIFGTKPKRGVRARDEDDNGLPDDDSRLYPR